MVMIVSGASSMMNGRYRIEREIGRGGMATVFLATDMSVDRPVAIKVLDPELAAAVGAERFHREIHIASTLTHPHILPVYDSGESEGRLFYVMPLVQGESLRERLNQAGQLPVEEAVRLTCEVASALEYAHSQGVVHRDIKPENILLEHGHAVVADFGIARATGGAADAPALTQTGMSLGTPTYMSPEQAMGEKKVDGRSDQYSLACVTYEMLTGEPPFSAPTAQALVARHLTTPAPLISTVRPVVGAELEDAILRALEKVPADRWPTIADYAAEVAQCGALNSTAVRRAPGGRATNRSMRTIRREGRTYAGLSVRSVVAGAALLILAVAGLVGWRWRHAALAARLSSAEERRIAVLYFQDISADHSLGFLADGLTEGLIERLRDVPALDVVSRDGVALLRGKAPRLDSVATRLNVGTMVTGAVETEGTDVRITLRLVDASGTEFDRGSFAVPQDALLTARDSVTTHAAEMIRGRIGGEIQLREQREQASDATAWSLVQRAERLRDDTRQKAGADTAATARAFDSVDAMLVVAAARDARWSRPEMLRGRLALTRARLATGNAAVSRAIDEGLAASDRALARNPRDADALETRGALRYERYTRNLAATPADEKVLMRDAEADLLRATQVNPTQASAFNVLSALDYRKPDLLMANIHARQALEADAFLAAADEVIWRLFATSYDLGRQDDAAKWCTQGHDRFPVSARFIQCRLWLGVMNTERPDVADAWRAVGEYVERVPAARRPLAEREARMLAAIPLIYAGMKDSARRVLDGARADRTIDPDGALIRNEALARVRLGERDAAVRLLKLFLVEHPQHRMGVTRNTWWWKDLQGDPEFKALIGTR